MVYGSLRIAVNLFLPNRIAYIFLVGLSLLLLGKLRVFLESNLLPTTTTTYAMFYGSAVSFCAYTV